jgi:hypothetical protein
MSKFLKLFPAWSHVNLVFLPPPDSRVMLVYKCKLYVQLEELCSTPRNPVIMLPGRPCFLLSTLLWAVRVQEDGHTCAWLVIPPWVGSLHRSWSFLSNCVHCYTYPLSKRFKCEIIGKHILEVSLSQALYAGVKLQDEWEASVLATGAHCSWQNQICKKNYNAR